MSEKAAPQVFDYAIDPFDTIVSVSEPWVEFARENAAPELGKVIGHSIWEYIEGKPTRDLYDVVFSRVRAQGDTIELPFRCDSPTVYRFMRLVVAPSDGGGVCFQGVLLREQEKPYEPMLDRALPRSGRVLEIAVDRGDIVRTGQVIARLENDDSTSSIMML